MISSVFVDRPRLAIVIAIIITIAGGDVLIRAASIANGTTRNAPTAPECVGDKNRPPTFCPTSATPIANIKNIRLIFFIEILRTDLQCTQGVKAKLVAGSL